MRHLPIVLGLLTAPIVCQAQGIITTVAGGGSGDYTKGGLATSLSLGSVSGTAVDQAGNLYIVDYVRILKVDPAGNLTTVAGGGKGSKFPGPATSVNMSPYGVALDGAGNLYISDTLSTRILKVDATGTISIFAGTGNMAYGGDGGPAIKATFEVPEGLAFDGAGNLYIADHNSGVIRKIDTAGIISTVAGDRSTGFSGDGGPATKAAIDNPTDVAADAAGNFYIAGEEGNIVRKVDTNGIISTVAGNGNGGFSGDGGPAVKAEFNYVTGLAVDGAGNLYIADKDNARVRRVDGNGIITTVAGDGKSGYTGDGGPATAAELSNPDGVSVDSSGNLYIADRGNGNVRKVTFPSVPRISANGVVNGASFQPGIVPGSWATIQGSNLSSKTDTWDKFIVNGRLPTTVDDVGVTVGGRSAYVYYISSGQINFIVPEVLAGSQPVVVNNSSGASAAVTVTVNTFGPAFFPWPNNQVVATRQDFSLAAKDGTFAGTTTPAKPGDAIILWGTGFGPTNPLPGQGEETPTNATYSTDTLPTVTINNVSATVYGAALAPGFAGLYQVAIQVPAALGNGDWPVVATIDGVASPSGAVLSVQQ
jgi:uncharacterized protein (TIGR03437 family)